MVVAHLPVPLSAPAAAALLVGGSHPVLRIALAHVGDSLTWRRKAVRGSAMSAAKL